MLFHEQKKTQIWNLKPIKGAVCSYVIMTIVVTKKWMDDRQMLLYGVVTAMINLLSIGTIASVVEYQSSFRV